MAQGRTRPVYAGVSGARKPHHIRKDTYDQNHFIKSLYTTDEEQSLLQNNWESTCSAEKPACQPPACQPACSAFILQNSYVQHTERLKSSRNHIILIDKTPTSINSISLRQRIHPQPTLHIHFAAATFIQLINQMNACMDQ